MSVTTKTTVTLKAEAHCPSHSLADIRVRDLSFAIDEPEARGGTNKGPTPTDAAIAALVGCTNVIAHKCADSLNLDIGHLDIAAECVFDRRGVTLSEEIDTPFQAIKLVVTTGNVLSEMQLEMLSREVARYCPLSKLFSRAGTIIEEEWLSAS
jgi:uncharacterized OsmC-like protein